LGEAEQWLRKAIAINERLGNEAALGTDYNNLGMIHQARGDLDQAEKLLRRALALAESKGSAATLATVKANLEALLKQREAKN
jgi:tetratricopeptide (TPR) repeat protein